MAESQARRYVANMYPSRRWRDKVRSMTEAQCVAIMLKNQAKPKKETSK